MTSSIPGIFGWPVIAFMVAVLASRYLWLNNTAYDKYLNRTLVFMLVIELLREPQVQQLLQRADLIDVTTSQQMSLGMMIFASIEFIAFTSLWSGRSVDDTRKLYVRYRWAATLLLVAFLAAGTGARHAGQPFETYDGWDGVLASALYLVIIVILSAQLLRMCIAEVIRSATRRERLVAAAGIALGLLMGFATLDALILPLTDQLGWTETSTFRLRFHSYNFFYESIGASMIAAAPLTMKLLTYRGLEPVSRNWHKLQPLRQSMRQAVPASAFDLTTTTTQGRRRTPLELHQSTVEIRDAILQLRPYFGDIDTNDITHYLTTNNIAPRHQQAAIRALHLACAVQNKAAGTAPKPADSSAVVSSRPTTLEEETGDLLQLARWWPTACAGAQHLGPCTERAYTQ